MSCCFELFWRWPPQYHPILHPLWVLPYSGRFVQIIASENQPVRWITPLGLPVVQPYCKKGRHLVQNHLTFSIIAFPFLFEICCVKNNIHLVDKYDADQNLPSNVDAGKGNWKGNLLLVSILYFWLSSFICWTVIWTKQILIVMWCPSVKLLRRALLIT